MPRVLRRLLSLIQALLLLLIPFAGLAPQPVIAAEGAPTPTNFSQRLPLIYFGFKSNGLSIANYLGEPLMKDNTQWNMYSIGADDAWKLGYGGAIGKVVAIVDTGVDLKNSDLVDNLRPGYDFVDNDTVPQDESALGHGTHIAGIIAAELNGKGVLGVAPYAGIMPVRVLDKDGAGTAERVAQGIQWAADHGASIINLSLGYRLQSNFNSAALLSAIQYAQSKGCLVVAAVGNSHSSTPSYPAAYPGVLAVSAVDRAGNLAPFSNYGSYVSLAAPGVDVTSTIPGGTYLPASGTSQAAAHVSGVAALVMDAHHEYTATQVAGIMKQTAISLGDPQYFGSGLIQADKALMTPPLASPALANSILETGLPGDDRQAPIEAGKVLVRFSTGYQPAGTEAASVLLPGVSAVESLPSLDLQVWSVPAGSEWAAVDALRARPGVVFAEPNYLMEAY